MGCSHTNVETTPKTVSEKAEASNLNKIENKNNNQTVINANKKKVTVYKTIKKKLKKV